jgi:DNA-binding MarR family transcriptional regulator
MVVDMDTQLASDLRTVISRLIKKLRKKSAAGLELSLTERSTLALLDMHGELLPNELASMEKITNQSMSQVLNHLQEVGYITRRTSQQDRRKSIVRLSARGASVLAQMRRERDSWLYQALTQACTASEIALLKKAVGPLKKLVDFEE